MICLICRQAEIVDGITSVRFERGEMRLVVNRVPARICPNCEEAFVDEEIAVQLLQDAENLSKAGILQLAYEYGHGTKNGILE